MSLPDNQHIACALWENVQKWGRQGLELEFRVGHVVANQFMSRISKQGFDICTAYLSTHAESEIHVSTTETMCGEYRHVVTHQQDNHPPPPPYCIVKHKTFRYDMLVPETPYTIRASLAQEYPTAALPSGTDTKLVTRTKKRIRYVKGPWAYDLTVVVSNTDIDSEETYECEVELLDTSLLFQYTMDHIIQWGTEHLMALCRMMAREDAV